MKVAVWTGAGYPAPYATGVGKHVRHMTGGLAARSGWDVKLLLAREHALAAVTARAGSPLAAIPFLRLPFARRTVDALWRTAAWPPIDLWAEGAGWILCPRELYVPVREARTAVSVHDLYHCEPSCPETLMRHRLDRRLNLERAFENATVLLAVSQFTKDRLVELMGVDARKIRVVGNGVEAGFFEAAGKDPAEVSPFRGRRYVLSVGGLTLKKGGGALLSLAHALEHVAPGLTLIVVGPVESAFRRGLSHASNVRIIDRGFPDEQMHTLVRGAEALVMLSEYEGFGIPALEAMAAGVPVVAARRAALPEIVGDAGVLVDPARTSEVAEAIADLGCSRAWRGMLIETGRVRARQFTWDRCVGRLADALTEFGRGSAEGSRQNAA